MTDRRIILPGERWRVDVDSYNSGRDPLHTVDVTINEDVTLRMLAAAWGFDISLKRHDR